MKSQVRVPAPPATWQKGSRLGFWADSSGVDVVQALKSCKDKCREYAECTHERVFSIAWACRSEFSALNQCLKRQ